MTLRRIAALACLLTLVILPSATVAWTVHRTALMSAETAGVEARRQALMDRARISPKQVSHAEPRGAEDYFLKAESRPLAAAALQAALAERIESAGLQVEEFEYVELGEQDATFGAVGLRVSFASTTPALQDILFQIEQRFPVMIVDTLSVRAERRSGGSPYEATPLRVVLSVKGFSEPAT